MNKRCRNIYFNILRRVLAIIVLFVTIAVVLYPGGKVFAVANWDGMPGTYQIDLTGTPIPAGRPYKYEKPLTGLPGSNALFRDSKPDAIAKNLDKAFDMPESAGTNFGELELVDNYLIYTPASDLPTMEVKVLLQLCTVGKSKTNAYCFLFQVEPSQADAQSGGLANLSYSLDGKEPVAVADYQPEIQNYQVIFPSDTPVGTVVSLAGTALDSEAAVTFSPEKIELSQQPQTQTLTVTTPSGSKRDYAVDFSIQPPEIPPSVRIDGVEYQDGDTLLLDYGETVQFDIDTGSGSVAAASFGVRVESGDELECLRPVLNEYGSYQQFSSEVIGWGTSQATVRFYRADGTEMQSICLTIQTRANYQEIKKVLESLPQQLNLYTDETVKAVQQLQQEINYDLAYTDQTAVSLLATQLAAAVDALQPLPADYSSIDQLKSWFEMLPDIYTAETTNAVKQQLESLNLDLDIFSQALVDSTAEKIREVIDGLAVRSEEFAELDVLLRQIPVDLGGYSEYSTDRLKQVLQQVREQLPTAADKQIASFVESVQQAVAGLRMPGNADTSRLETFLQTLPDSFSEYTDQSAQVVRQWMEQANTLLVDDGAVQQQIDSCLEQLEAAVDGLTLRPADYTEIQKLIDRLPDDLSGYTSGSVEAVTQLIAGIDWNLNITDQEQLQQLAKRIEEGIEKLVPNSQPETQPDQSDEDTESDADTPEYTTPIVIPEGTIPVEDIVNERPDWIFAEDLYVEQELESGWERENGETVFYQEGKKATGWQEIDGERYYFTEEGYLSYGWLQLQDQWYYLGLDGSMRTGWVQLGNAWYYLYQSTGEMAASQWLTLEGETYCFSDWGGMVSSSWQQTGEDWYFFNGGGYMVKNQWVEWKGSWYYLTEDGKMAVDTVTPDGYRVDKNGVWID